VTSRQTVAAYEMKFLLDELRVQDVKA